MAVIEPPVVAEPPIRDEDAVVPATEPAPERLLPGAIKVVHAFWLAGMSCDGCSIAAVGATQPPVEALLTGSIPGIPKVILHHPVLSVSAGEAFVHSFRLAAEDALDAPFVIIFEGSVPDERIAARFGGYWSGLGAEETDAGPQPVPTAEWLRRMAPHAAAVIAVGTCATWGGIPAAIGNPTGAMSVMDYLGEDYRSALGLPVVNIPGCAPQGDNMTETIAAVLLFLQGIGPLPAFDELGRPAWLFDETVHRKCTRAGYYEEGDFAEDFGDKQCLVEIGCWGPVVQCNITKRGALNHVGGCMNVGAACIGCTMPAFPDGFSPFYKRPPGTFISSSMSRSYGSVVRNLRRVTRQYQNRTRRWKQADHVPSGWGHVPEPGPIKNLMHYFYEKLQFMGAEQPTGIAKKPGGTARREANAE